MKTDNRSSEKDLNANPDSSLNTNKPQSRPEQVPAGSQRPDRFPESHEAQGEMEKIEHNKTRSEKKKDDDIELLAGEVSGSVSTRDTGSNPDDIAGVSDLDRGMSRARRR
jgi:hypothetical protein